MNLRTYARTAEELANALLALADQEALVAPTSEGAVDPTRLYRAAWTAEKLLRRLPAALSMTAQEEAEIYGVANDLATVLRS